MAKQSISVEEMMKAGMHFGHQTFRRNPKMDAYIFGTRAGVHIIDLAKSRPLFERALEFVAEITKTGRKVVIVGTKRQAAALVAQYASQCQMPYVNQRWLGGLLTNFNTISKRLKYLRELDEKYAKNDFQGMTKKERVMLDKQYQALQGTLGGVKELTELPGAVFVVDAIKDRIAVKEANKLGVPVVAIVDTNTNPVGIDYPIPANDDAKSSIEFVLQQVAANCVAAPIAAGVDKAVDAKEEANSVSEEEEAKDGN